MEDHHNSSKSVGVWEKILSAVTVYPVYRTIRRISSRQKDSGPASPAPNPSLPIHIPVAKTIGIQTIQAGPAHPKSLQGSQHHKEVEVPIKFDYSSPHSPNVEGKPAPPQLPIQNKQPKLEAPAKALPGEGQHHVVQEGKQEGLDINDRFSDYIKHAMMKIRTVSNVGGGKNATGPDDAQDTKKKDNDKDHFSEYLNRAKKKFMTTTSIGSGSMISFKRE